MKNVLHIIVTRSFGLALVLSLSCISKPKAETPNFSENPVERLLDGNVRFKENHPIHPDQTLERLRALKKGQQPFAVIVSCSDSRVPPELIFDQGLGDLFVIRNAGNIISDYELGSIEYAVEHLDTKLVVVLGHKECGAIGAFIAHRNDSLQNHIQHIINYIKLEPEELAISDTVSDYYQQSILANVAHGVHVVEHSEPVLKEFLHEKKIEVVGMLYDIETGEIKVLKNEK